MRAGSFSLVSDRMAIRSSTDIRRHVPASGGEGTRRPTRLRADEITSSLPGNSEGWAGQNTAGEGDGVVVGESRPGEPGWRRVFM